MRQDIHYEELHKVLPRTVWDVFRFEEYYLDERNVLLPALLEEGFTNVTFSTGDRDSFGPLSRIVSVTDPRQGKRRFFIYG